MLNRRLADLLRRLALRLRTEEELTTVSRGEQLILAESWSRLRREGAPMPSLADVEFRAFSQSGEDGILLFVLTVVGFTNRVVIELGCGDGRECNAANLILNHGCTGMLVDGDATYVEIARRFYQRARDAKVWPPRVVQAFITRESVNALLEAEGVTGDVDLLSLDIDGMDFWVWEALTSISPRVVMVETNNLWDAKTSVAIPYQASFQAEYVAGAPDYSGASLLAFTRLARAKGYRLVGTNRFGFNAVFVRDDIAHDTLPEVSVESCLQHPQARHAAAVRGPRIAHLPTVAIPEGYAAAARL